MTRERSRARGTTRPTLETVHLQLSALPRGTGPLATARPCHARPTHERRISTPRAGGMKSLSRGRLALSPGRWRIVRKCKSHPAPGVPQVYRCGACCCAAVVDWSVRTAPLPLTTVMVGWSVGGGCLVGGGSLAIHEMTGGRKTTNLPAFFTVLRVLKTPEPTKYSSRSGIPRYILLHCCTAVVAWSVGGGGACGWVERVV